MSEYCTKHCSGRYHASCGCDFPAEQFRFLNACMYGDLKIVRSLLARRPAVVESEFGYYPLMKAAEYGHVKVVKLLLEAGADVNEKTGGGFTPLILAAENGHVEVVDLLMKKPAIEPRSWADVASGKK